MSVCQLQINGYHTSEPRYTLLDEDDYDRFKSWKWQEGKCGYARRNICIRDEFGNKKWRTLLLHRLIVGIDDDDDTVCVDHINGNRLDNQKHNLRIVTMSENAVNRHVVLNSTGYLGVTEQKGRFIARARRNGEVIRLGSYSTPEEARAIIEYYDATGCLPFSRKTIRPVCQYSLDGRLLAVFKNCADASRQSGVTATNINRCANGNRNTAGGFSWAFLPELAV